MAIVSPDILADLRDLPLFAIVTLAILGLSQWTCGWWGHRFWMGLLTSFATGLSGLRMGPDWGLDPLVAGILLAVAGGALSLAICRVGLFFLYGLGAWHLMQALAPKAAHPIVCILVGGVLAVMIFRFSIILLTSTAGTWLTANGGLLVAERIGKLDAPAWVTARPLWINIGFVALVFVGVIFQYWDDNRLRKFLKTRREWLEWMNKKGGPPGESSQRGLLARMKRAA